MTTTQYATVLSSRGSILAMLEEYVRGSMAYRQQSEQLTGSIVSMRKALELMTWALRICLSPEQDQAKWRTRRDIAKALEHAPRDFYDAYLTRTDPMLYEIKALALGSPEQEGISQYLHYQGVLAGKSAYGDCTSMRQAERASIARTYALYSGRTAAFASLMQRFLVRTGLNAVCTPGVHPALYHMMQHACLPQDPPGSGAEAFERTLDMLNPDEYWLDHYCGVLNRLILRKDDRVCCDTVFACCRLIAERYGAFVLERYDAANPGTAPADRSRYTLGQYLADLEALPAPRKLVDQQNMKDRLERVRQIQKQANLMEHFLNVSYDEEMLRLPQDEKRQFDLNMEQMAVNCSVLVQEMVNERLPASVHEWIDSRIGRARTFAMPGLQTAPAADGFNFYEEIRSIFARSTGRAGGEPSWIADRLKKKKATPDTPAPPEDPPTQEEIIRSSYLQQPSCLKREIGEMPGRNFTIIDQPGCITRAYSVQPLLIPRRKQFIYITVPIASVSTPQPDGGRHTRFDLHQPSYDHDDSDVWGYTDFNILLLTFTRSGECALNSALLSGDRMYVSKKPMKLGKSLLPSRKASEILRRKMTENASMSALSGLGILHLPQAESTVQNDGLERIDCPFDESYFQYAIFDPDTADPVIPQLYVSDGGLLRMQLDIDPAKEYLCLEINEDADDKAQESNIYYYFGVGCLHGAAGMQKDIMKAADWFHAGLMANPHNYRCAYELGCMFRYLPELHSDEDAYEYLNIAAKGGHRQAQYELSRLILQLRVDDKDVLRARQHISELLGAGYIYCGSERIADLLDSPGSPA